MPLQPLSLVSSAPDRREPAKARAPRDRRGGPGTRGPDEHLASLLSPYSFEADQYRVLRRLVNQAREAKRLHVLAVSSPAAGDGKTTTTINLAATLAMTPGLRVLLVETDLRRPAVAARLDLPVRGRGLVDAVEDTSLSLSHVIQPTTYGLAVLPAGSAPGNPYQVLDSPRLGQLLTEARSAYDLVVLDMPPVLLVPDCSLMSPWVDGFLIVVRAHRTPRVLLAEALNAMDPAKVFGIVFNGDNRPLSGYYKQYYASYHHSRTAKHSGWWHFWHRG